MIRVMYILFRLQNLRPFSSSLHLFFGPLALHVFFTIRNIILMYQKRCECCA